MFKDMRLKSWHAMFIASLVSIVVMELVDGPTPAMFAPGIAMFLMGIRITVED